MRKAMAAAVVALVVGAPMLPQQEVLASDCSAAGYSTKAGNKGWIGLHRPDGEVVRIKDRSDRIRDERCKYWRRQAVAFKDSTLERLRRRARERRRGDAGH